MVVVSYTNKLCLVSKQFAWSKEKYGSVDATIPYFKNTFSGKKSAGLSVNVFKNRNDLFYAGLEPGNVDNNSTFIAVD